MMRRAMAALAVAVAMLAGGCGILSGGGGRDVTEHFEDPAAQELARAVSSGSQGEIRKLVEEGTSVGTTGKDGVTMLQWAVYEGRHRSLETLLELGADPEQHGLGGSTVMHSAAIARTPDALRILLEADVDPDLRHARTERTPLMGAVGMRTNEHFTLLLEAGADVTLADRMGVTALHLAAMVNAGTHVLELLERGADPLAENSTGATFQDFYWTTNADIMNERGLRYRELVAEWLQANDVELAEGARWTKNER